MVSAPPSNTEVAPPLSRQTTPLKDSFSNFDLGFSQSDRALHGIRGLLPNVEESLDLQKMRALKQLRSKPNDLEKYIYLSSLRQTNTALFFAIVNSNLTEITPLIYTPTVGAACANWSDIYRKPEGLHISLADQGSIKSVLENWPLRDEARFAVVTDGSRILGLGDLGLGGLGISIGKLSLYVAGAGVEPKTTIPIVLDMGTNNERLLNDPLYLGLRQPRRSLEENVAFLEEFMSAMKDVFPKALVQFEDFSSEAAFFYLKHFRNKYLTFNDDIQGTGSVILGGFINASRQQAAPLADQRVLFLGAGSAAVGVAQQLMTYFISQGLTKEEAKRRFWLVDTKGLITLDRGDKLAEHKIYFARDDNEGCQFKSLEEIIDYVKPSALIGLSTTKGAFTEICARKMAALNDRPIIFPLSNPTDKCEMTFQEALDWTDRKVIFASGSPFQPININGKMYEAGQGNNFYVFSGIALGSVLCSAHHVTEAMVDEASFALASSLNAEETAAGLLYPRIDRIQEISAIIAMRVIRSAQKAGLDTNPKYRLASDDELLKLVKSKQYQPEYSTPARL